MTMSVDVFGRHLKKKDQGASRGPPGVGFNLTSTGDYDIRSKKLCNVADATNQSDAVNLKTLEAKIDAITEKYNQSISSLLKSIGALTTDINENREDILNLEKFIASGNRSYQNNNNNDNS